MEGKAKMAAVDTGIGNEADGGANQSGRHEPAVVALQLLLFHNYYYHSFFFCFVTQRQQFFIFFISLFSMQFINRFSGRDGDNNGFGSS